MAISAFLRRSGFRSLNGYTHGPNFPPTSWQAAPGRRRSLKHPHHDDDVTVEGGGGWLTRMIPQPWRQYFNESTVELYSHSYENARGRHRYELNWPWAASTNAILYNWAMTVDEAEEYYSTPKEGVDFMYNAPAGHHQNPLVIKSQTPNMFVTALVFCKGMCGPHVREGHNFWRMYPGQRYHCISCQAHIVLDGKSDCAPLLPSVRPTALPSPPYPPRQRGHHRVPRHCATGGRRDAAVRAPRA